MRGAECHSDHQLICVRVRVESRVQRASASVERAMWFDVAKLSGRIALRKTNHGRVVCSLKKLKVVKQEACSSCILPEMVKAASGRAEFLTSLLDLVHSAW